MSKLGYLILCVKHLILAGCCMAVDREFAYIFLCIYSFVICWPPLSALRLPLCLLWLTFGSLGTALGPLWGTLGCHECLLGRPRAYNKFVTK